MISHIFLVIFFLLSLSSLAFSQLEVLSVTPIDQESLLSFSFISNLAYEDYMKHNKQWETSLVNTLKNVTSCNSIVYYKAQPIDVENLNIQSGTTVSASPSGSPSTVPTLFPTSFPSVPQINNLRRVLEEKMIINFTVIFSVPNLNELAILVSTLNNQGLNQKLCTGLDYYTYNTGIPDTILGDFNVFDINIVEIYAIPQEVVDPLEENSVKKDKVSMETHGIIIAIVVGIIALTIYCLYYCRNDENDSIESYSHKQHPEEGVEQY